MKKYYFLGVLALTLVFTSCSIEKRHYMNGYHVTWNHKAPNAAQHTNNNTVAVNETVAAVEVEAAAPVATVNEATEATTVAAPTLVQAPVQSTEQNAVVEQSNNTTIATNPAAAENTTLNKSKFIQKRIGNTDAPATPETNKVLLVILALLLPPLAMYLYEGKWTKRCTTNVILTLLCGIPGVIHALVVILGNK